jgi:hypothetical protein
MLLVSDTTDWTRNMPRDEYPAIQRIYDLYGQRSQVSMVQFEAVHNFNQQSREAVYKFFSQVNPGLARVNELTEHNIQVPIPQQMRSLSNRTLPANALDLNGLFHEWRARSQAQNAQIKDALFLRERLQQTLAIEIPDNVISESKGQSIVLSLPGFRDRVEGVFIRGAKSKADAVAIVIDSGGSAAALQSETVKRLLKDGRPVLALDVFQTGAARRPRDREDSEPVPPENAPEDPVLEQNANAASGGVKFLTFNVTDDAARVQDIVTAIVYVSRAGHGVELYARADAAVWATFAAAVSNVPVSLHLENAPKLVTDADYLVHFNVPGILRAGGLPVAERLAAAQ